MKTSLTLYVLPELKERIVNAAAKQEKLAQNAGFEVRAWDLEKLLLKSHVSETSWRLQQAFENVLLETGFTLDKHETRKIR